MINFIKEYNKENFIAFLNEFLPDDFVYKDTKIEIKENHPYFKKATLLGSVESLDGLMVIEVERIRAEKSRATITKELFKFLELLGYSNALIVTFSKEESHYRFSFITSELKWVTEKKVKRQFSNPIRYSFLLGKNSKIHTPSAQLLKLGKIKNFNDLISRFNIEVVGEDFFKSYNSLYTSIKNHLDNDKVFSLFSKKKNIGTDFFAKKLLGQIVFCYFLQKKGWLGVDKKSIWGTGNQNFLREQFNKYNLKKKNFFNKFLEYFFYQGLNKKNKDDYLNILDCKVPYIGGELFYYFDGYDWKKENLNFPNTIFSNKENKGVLDIFDLYNFTIDEMTSLDIEIAIDPEMLGKVFERLLDTKERKSKGAFYTPRRIVNYMCKNSILEYLHNSLDSKKITKLEIEKFIIYENTNREFPEKKIFSLRDEIDKELSSVKIIDPAIGSGAFTVELMNMISELRFKLNSYLGSSRNKYELKKHVIENSIYGVDIDKAAIEIAKLRLWLSLIIDKKEKEQINPLPNLDFKIIEGDSLESIEIDVFAYKKLIETERLKNEYISTTSKNLQKELKTKIFENLKRFREKNNFDIRVYFSEVFNIKKGFDIVIGNPPYINFANLDENKRKKYSNFKVLRNKTDIYAFFIENSKLWLSQNSHLAFIITNTWKAADSFLLLRKFLVSNFYISKIVNLDLGTFKASNVPLIIFLQKKNASNYNIDVFNSDFKYFKSLNINEIKNDISCSFNTTSTIEEDKLIQKISLNGKKLYNYLRFSRGIKTSNDKKFIVKKALNKDHKKVFRGRNISAYKIDWDNEYINYRPDLMKKKAGSVSYSKEFFETEKKIVLQRIAQNLPVSIDYNKNYFLDTVIVSDYRTITKNLSMEYICALLNSKLIRFWYNNKYQLATVGIYELENIPIIYSKDEILIEKITKMVKEIFNRTSKNEKVKDILDKIDNIFYKIYSINSDEIEIIEKYNKFD